MTQLDNPNLEDMLQMGIRAAQRGDREGAQMQLQQVLDNNQSNDRAWLYMAYIEPDSVKRISYLQTALRYNPNNPTAKRALANINRQRKRKERRVLEVGLVMIFGALSLGAVLVLVGLLLA